MEPTSLVKAATEAALESGAKESTGFLRAILGEPLAEFGGILGDRVRERRHKNLIAITERAKQRLDKAGVSPKQVPLKIIHPLLEAASLEDELEHQELWANLMANAADPRNTISVPPIYITILNDLTSPQARFIEALYIIGDRITSSGHRDQWEFPLEKIRYIAEQVGLVPSASKDDTFDVFTDNMRNLEVTLYSLQSNGVIEGVRRLEDVEMTVPARAIEEKDIEVGGPIRPTMTYAYRLTELGQAVIRACKAPEK